MGKFIKKCMSMLLLVSIISTSVFPSSFASFAEETQGEQMIHIEPIAQSEPIEPSETTLDAEVETPAAPDVQAKANETELKAQLLSEAKREATNPLGIFGLLGNEAKIEDNLEIKGINMELIGGIEKNPITGEIFDGRKKTINIEVDYDDEDLDNIMKTRLTEVWIDEVSYPLRDSKTNLPNFYLYEGYLRITAAYTDGKRAVADFEKRQRHRVELRFDDGSVEEYEDYGYVKRNFDNDPIAQPPKEEEPKPFEPIDKTVKGYLANKTDKKKKSMADDGLVRDIQVKTSTTQAPMPEISFVDVIVQFNEISVGGATGKVTGLTYKNLMSDKNEAKLFNGEEGKFVIIYNEKYVPKDDLSKDGEIELGFTIDLGGDEPMQQSAILILDWNNDFRFEGEDAPAPSPEPKYGIGNKYSIKEVTIDSNNNLNIKLNEKFDRAHEDQIQKLKVNGKEFKGSDYTSSGTYLDEFMIINNWTDVVNEAKKNLDGLELEIWFNDGSLLKYKAGGAVQPPQEEKEREVKGYMLEEGEEKVSPANKAIKGLTVKPIFNQGKKSYEVIIRLAQVSIGDDKTAGIKTFSYNQEGDTKVAAESVTDYTFDSYKMLIPAEKIQPDGSETDTKIKVQYTLKTDKEGFTKPFDAILLLDWNNDFDEPGNFAKKFKINGVEVKDDPKEVRITLNNGLLNSQLGLVKQVKVNDDNFAVQASDLAQAGDNKVLIIKKQDFVTKAKEKTTTGWTLTVIFNDDSKLEYYVKKQAQPTPPPVQPGGEIAKKYEVKNVLIALNWAKQKRVHIVFEPKMESTDAQGIKTIEINGKVFENASTIFFRNFDGILETVNQEAINVVDGKKSNTLKITFADNSVLTYGSVTPPAPSDTIASKYQIKGTETKKDYKELYVAFDKEISIDHANGIKNITINSVLFDPKPTTLRKHWSGRLVVAGDDIIEAAEKADPVVVSITFADDSVLTNAGGTAPTPPPEQPQEPQEGEAKGRSIKAMEVDKTENEFWIVFTEEIPTFWKFKIPKIQLDGQDFDIMPADLDIRRSSILIKRADILEKVFAVEDVDKMGIIISFNDKSKIKKNVVEKPQEPKLTIESDLKNGDYTLTFKAYKAGSSEISTFGDFFDVRAKLKVEGDKKTVTLLNHAAAGLMLDFAVQTDTGFKSIEKTNVKRSFKGEISSAEYTFDLKQLSGKHIVAILGEGPMGGNQGEVGKFDSSNYKRAEIVFDRAVTEGWTNFLVPEKAEEAAKKSHERLIEALIRNNVDTDSDGQISTEELQNATGIETMVAGKKRSNVLDLENVKVDDISMLKDLGPQIKFLNLNACGIKSLPQDVFQNARGVRELYLGGNQITKLHAGTFDNMTNLEYIDFDGNRLGEIPAGIFDHNTKFKIVSFMNSGVTSLPAGLLTNLKRLEHLYLQENSIETLDDDFFANNHRLKDVHLHHNKLTSLPSSLGKIAQLKEITAQHNAISRVPESFKNLKKLENLDLESNQVEYIPTELYKNMIHLAPHALVRLDLSMNNLTSLPVDEMIEALESGGKMLTKFEVNKNYLKPVVSKEEELKLKRLGIDFDKSKESYYPQKGSIESSLSASNGKIMLNQEFDILELYYWDQGDSAYYGGKEEFKDKNEFYNYLMGAGRDYNKVDRGLDRDVAIQTILNKKGVKWEVETIITKNGSEFKKIVTKNNPKEGLKQTFEDPTMLATDKYTLTKKLYVKGVFGWALALENTVSGSSDSNAQPNKDQKFVHVQINRFDDETKKSVANDAINPIAKVVNKEGKFEYTVEFKPLAVGTASGNIIKFRVKTNGMLQEIEKQPAITAGYKSAYTFTLDQEAKKVEVEFEADIMNEMAKKPNPQKAYLIFGDEAEGPKPNRAAKAYILQEDKKKLSMADKALVHDVVLKPIQSTNAVNEYEVKLEFNEMTIQKMTAGVGSLSVMIDGQKKAANEISKGVFTFNIPESMVKPADASEDTELKVEFTVEPAVQGHDKPFGAILVLDWNGDYVPPKAELPQSGKKIPAQIITMDGTKLSMAGKALEELTAVPTNRQSGPFKLIALQFKFKELEMMGTTAGVEKLEVQLRDQWMEATAVKDQKGVFTLDMFENVLRDAGKDTEFKIRVTTYPKVQGHDKPQEARLILDWDSSIQLDDQGGLVTPIAPPAPESPNPPQGGGGSGGSGPIEETSYVSVWMRKAGSNDVSMGNQALSPTAKVVRSGDSYTYTITLNPINIEFGGKTHRGTVTEFSIYDGSSKQIVYGNGEYTFTLNRKVDELKVAFVVDVVKDSMGEQDAYIVFNWSNDGSAPQGGTGGGAIDPKDKEKKEKEIKDEQVPLAEAAQDEKQLEEKAIRIVNNKDTAKYKKYYKPETIKAIQKALEAYQNKEEGALEKLEVVMESARIERVTNILSEGYMSGYPNKEFRPDNKITRAEVSAMFMELIEDVAKEKIDFKDIKDGLWYSEAVNKMVSLGYIRMNGEGIFSPEKPITRAEYAYILAKLKKLPIAEKQLKDVPSDHWAAEAIASCVEAGILAGYEDGTFKPDRAITRAEAVAMISRAFDIKPNVTEKAGYSDVKKTHWAYDAIMTASKN